MSGYENHIDYAGPPASTGWRLLLGVALFVAVTFGLAYAAFAQPMAICAGAGDKTCVIDGDTIRWKGEKIRLAGIDTAELTTAKCRAERMLAERARDRLAEILDDAATLKIERKGFDKHRRTLAHLAVNGRDAGAILIADGLAVAWEGRRGDWC